MREFGEFLKSERELRGLTLLEISLETKIRIEYLEDIEQGEFKRLPGEFYTRAYLRAYSKFLGLDESLVLDKFEESLAKIEASGEKDIMPIGKKWDGTLQNTVASKGEFPKDKRVSLVIGIGLIALIIGLSAYLIWYFGFSDPKDTQLDIEQQIDYINYNETDVEELDQEPNSTELDDNFNVLTDVLDQQFDSLQSSLKDELVDLDAPNKINNITLVSTGVCWIEVKDLDSGKLVKDTILRNSEYNFDYEGNLKVVLGNPKELLLILNGQSIDLANDVKELTIDSNGAINILKRW